MKRFIHTDQDKQAVIAFIQNSDTPMTIIIDKGINGKRSVNQNRLQRLWLNELAEQGDMSNEEYRAFCKLHFGVPILRAENDNFQKGYDAKVKWRSYAEKLELMAEPFDFPVTRLMTVKQHKQYLDKIYLYFIGQGFYLTDPHSLGWEL